MSNNRTLMLPDYRVLQRDLLLEIARAITAQLELSEVLRMVLRASVGMLAGQVGLIALKSELDDKFYIRAISGVTTEQVPELNLRLHELMASVDDGADHEYLNTKLREMAVIIDPKLLQSVAMPLIFAQQPLGLLIIFRSYQSNVTPDDVQVLQSFANQAAIAVHNAQLYEKIEHERKRLSAILQHRGDGVMILGPDLTILQVNRAFERMTAWDSLDAVGLKQNAVIIWDRIDNQDLIDAMKKGWPSQNLDHPNVETLYVEGDLARRDGLSLGIGITYAPLFGGDGRLLSIIANIRDITNFRKAQEMQNVFISTVSHELRTPIALIKGYASTLRREDVKWDPHTARDYLAIIEDEADRLTELVQDLLTASKIQAERKVTLNIGDLRLDLLAHRAVERLSTQTNKHQIVLDFPEQLPVIAGDEMRLRQVIDNLLNNAIKYSPEGGTITVGGYCSNETVSLYVQDEGIGISESEQERIFDRFYRVDGNLSRKTKGTGLGLYLTKAIIEAHHGDIHVDSHPGQGSTFTFTLPR